MSGPERLLLTVQGRIFPAVIKKSSTPGNPDGLNLILCLVTTTVARREAGASTGRGERHRLSASAGWPPCRWTRWHRWPTGRRPSCWCSPLAGGAGLGFTLPVTLAIAGLLAVLVASYRQVIAAFPDGGGSYGVAKPHLGRRTAWSPAASLVIDYVLTSRSRWRPGSPR